MYQCVIFVPLAHLGRRSCNKNNN